MNEFHSKNATLPPVSPHTDAVCDRFDAAWRAGPPPCIEDYLNEVPEAERPTLLRELILLDIEYRRQQGETPQPADYQARFAGTPPDWLAAALAGGALSHAGRYQLHEEIARGGMGAIYRAHDPDLRRSLAVKVLLDEHRGRPDLERRFLEEAQLAGQLQHPGIAPGHEIGTLADGRPFIARKLIRGRTLAELLAERGASPVALAVPVPDRPPGKGAQLTRVPAQPVRQQALPQAANEGSACLRRVQEINWT